MNNATTGVSAAKRNCYHRGYTSFMEIAPDLSDAQVVAKKVRAGQIAEHNSKKGKRSVAMEYLGRRDAAREVLKERGLK